MPRTPIDPERKPLSRADRTRFCHEGCRNGWRCDRVARLIYPMWKLNGEFVDHRTACTRLHLCHYCEKDLRR